MRGLFAAVLLIAALPSSALAQECEVEPEPEDQVRAAARPHYVSGIEASRADRWLEARESFQRAADIVDLSPIVYNLATAQAETGMFVEAAENYRKFLRRCVSRQTPELRAEAQQLLAGISPRIGRLNLRVENLSQEVDQVLIDGDPINLALLGTDVPINPGSHHIRVMRQRVELSNREVQIQPGQRATLSLAVDAYVPPSGGGGGGGGGDDTGLIVGLVIGAIALLGGGAALTVVLLLDGQGGVELPAGTWGRPAQVPLLEF